MELEEIENKIGQLQYEISCLGLDKEELTGVSIRTEELKDLVKKLTIPNVVGQNEQLVCDCGNKLTDKELYFGQCLQCDKNIEEAN